MAHTAASHLSMKLGERQGEGAAQPKGLLILAHLSLFLIQLIKALIRLTVPQVMMNGQLEKLS